MEWKCPPLKPREGANILLGYLHSPKIDVGTYSQGRVTLQSSVNRPLSEWHCWLEYNPCYNKEYG